MKRIMASKLSAYFFKKKTESSRRPFNFLKLSAVILIAVFAGYFAAGFIQYRIFELNMSLYGKRPKSILPGGQVKKNTVSEYQDIIKYNMPGALIDGPLINYNAGSTFAPPDFDLIGTIHGSLNYAFFTDKTSGKERFVPQGGEIKQGYYLKSVGRRSVVVTSFGRSFVIKLVKANNNNGSGGSPAAGLNGAPAGNFKTSVPIDAVKKTGPNSYLIDRSKIKKSDLNSIFTQMHAVPDIVGGKVIGFKVLSVVPSGIFANMGFRVGDVIKSVNGTALSSPQEAVNLLSGIMNENNVSIGIIRGGSNLTVNYTIE